MFSSMHSLRGFARTVLNTTPAARASVRGNAAHRGLHGAVNFYPAAGGTLVVAELYGLPSRPADGVFGFHIHEGDACRGNAEDSFAATGGHFNPSGKPHPFHAGGRDRPDGRRPQRTGRLHHAACGQFGEKDRLRGDPDGMKRER